MSDTAKKNATFGAKAFLASFFILLGLMVAAGILTRMIPVGSFDRAIAAGGEILVPGSYHLIPRPDYPVWRWFTAPFEVLASPDAMTAIVIIAFIAIAGGSFSIFTEAKVLEAAVASLSRRFSGRRYLLLAAVSLFGMLLGAVMGVFEESVLLVPIGIALAASLGWDVFTGLGMSVLAVGFGFAAAISNPFSIGTAQRLAGLPLFSGSGFRVFVFVLCYLLYLFFLIRHAKRTEKAEALMTGSEEPRLDTKVAVLELPEGAARGVKVFAASLLILFALILVVALTPGLSDFSMPMMALAFLIAGIVSGAASGIGAKRILRSFASGAFAVLPAGILILMALSVKRIILSGGVLDTVLYQAAEAAKGTSPYGAAALAYLLTLAMEFFIGSASAKAFLLMPMLAPLADLTGLSRQIMVQAYAFGDGFSNMLYPTNAVLLISLSLAGVSWPKWVKWILPLQIAVFVLTMGLLMLAVAIGYS